MINIFSWIAISAGVAVIAPQALMALVIHNDPSFTLKAWHVFLIYQAVNLLCLLHNIYTIRRTMWTFNCFCECGWDQTVTSHQADLPSCFIPRRVPGRHDHLSGARTHLPVGGIGLGDFCQRQWMEQPRSCLLRWSSHARLHVWRA